MRITVVAPFDPTPTPGPASGDRVGGVERVLGCVSRGLAVRGHDVTLLCSTDGVREESMERGVRVLREPRRATILRAPLVNLARHIPADAEVVHVPATYPFTTPPVLRRAGALGIPCILDFHFEPDSATGLGRMATQMYRQVGPRWYPLATSVLVRSRAYARGAPSLARIPEARWRVVPNGIDPGRFHPSGPRRDIGGGLLFVGRLVPYKGVDVLLRAMARLTPRLALTIAGEGPERGRLEALAQRLGVEARFLGRVSDEELPALYRGARLTVLPSINRQEAFGITLLESMACGTPVVASRLPGVEEVARLGGLLAEPGDPAALAAQLQRAAAGGLPGGAELASRIHRDFSWDAVTDRIEAAYLEATGRPPDARPAPPGGDRPAHPGHHAVL